MPTTAHPAIRRWFRLAALATVLAAVGASCADSGRTPLLSGLGEGAATLATDLSCDQLVELTKAQLEVGLDPVFGQFGAINDMVVLEADAADGIAEAAPRASEQSSGAAKGEPGEVVAGTNTQEAGVDEADLVKTDGRRIVTVLDGMLRVTTLDGTPQVDGELSLEGLGASGDEGRLFLRGDEALVLLPVWGSGPVVGTPGPRSDGGIEDDVVSESLPDGGTSPVPFDQGVRILRVDLSDDASPRVTENRTLEGSLVAARMVDSTARIVVRSPMPVMAELYEAEDLDAAEATVADLTAQDVLPRVSDEAGVAVPLGGCDTTAVLPVVGDEALTSRAMDTTIADQPATVSVLTVGDSLDDLAPATVAGLADIVYASPEAMYVTSTGWTEQGPNTFVHRFAMQGEDPAAYTGSGLVPGSPLNQYSLSESAGDLRIVTTTDDLTGTPEVLDIPVEDFVEPGIIEPDEFVPATEGRVTILRPDASGALIEIGVVEDLGVGERVQSVRFIGDMAYVVTFRQTDPLYALDLSDPTAPRALGELKITGFSEYLHPAGDGLLLGIGREATEDGMDTGFKASLFDVSDPTSPVEIDKVVIPDAYSPVGDDPLAFTWDPVAGHAVFPLEQYSNQFVECPPGADCAVSQSAGPQNTAVVLGVADRSLVPVAELTHARDGVDPWRASILRSVVVDRDLWTLGASGLGLSDADSPGEIQITDY